MRNFIYKIKSKLVNIDTKARRNLVIGICSLLFVVTAVVQIFNVNAEGYQLTRESDTTYSGHGSAAHVSIDYPSAKFSLNGGIGAVFCVDPNRATIDDDTANIYLSTTTHPDYLYYNVQVLAGSGTCPNAVGCGPLGKTELSDANAKFISKLAAYYLYINTNKIARAAVQTLIWEVSTGSRTSTTGVAPSYTSSTKSWYGKYVKDKKDNFADYYKAAINYAKDYSSSAPDTAKGSVHKMTYDLNKKKWTITIKGDYKRWNCKNSSNITIESQSNENIVLSSTKFIGEDSSEEITCTRDDDGNSNIGANGIWYYKKDWGPDDLGPDSSGKMVSKRYNYQMLVRGGTETLKTTLKAYTEGFPVKVTKKNENDDDLDGAEFTFTNNGDSSKKYVIKGNGSSVVIVPGTYTVEETKVPTGYSKMDTMTITINGKNNNENNVSFSNNTYTLTVNDTPLMINWYKADKDGNKLAGATFTATSDTTQIKYSLKVTDTTSPYYDCYIYDANGKETILTSSSDGTYYGEVCVKGMPEGTYTVTETSPEVHHTYGTFKQIDVKTSTNRLNYNASQKVIQYPTELIFTKTVSDETDSTDQEIKNMNTELIKQLKFNIKVVGTDNILNFVQETKDGITYYKYVDDASPLTTGLANAITDLQTNDDRQIIVRYLPWGINYEIEEKVDDGCTDPNGNSCSGMGFYKPVNGSFTITSSSSSNATSVNGNSATASITNTPTEIIFNKDDIYKYYTNTDKSEIDNKVNLLDTAKFVLKDANGNILTLKKISDGVYRYLPVGESNKYSNVTEINTYNGTLKITHLCRGQTYYIEEIRTTNPSEFILSESHPIVKYEIPENAPTDKQSITQTISNIPSRIRFEKRDLKYGYLIPDEKTTFKVYRCDESADKCHAETGEIVNFDKRAVLQGDNEDPIIDDVITSVEVYRYSKLNAKNVQELHPYKGILVLRYLSAGYYDKDNNYHKYKYVLVETQAPEGYDTPTGIAAETQFEVSDSTVEVEQTKVPNKPSKIIIRKYDSNGKLLTGARFKIYKVNKEDYNENLSAENQQKTLLSLKTIRDGVYEYRKEYDTTEFTTCVDKELQKCSSVTETLTYEDYEKSILKETIEIKQGEAIIQYLDVENFYVIEEVQAPEGHELPKNSEDRFKLIYLKNSVENVDAFTELINTETTFQFYKFDEYNNLLDGAEFKLQKLNDNKKYIDVNVTRTIIGDKTVYKVDSESENTIITTENGTAILAYMMAGQYRVVETKAAPGKELPKKTLNVATFFVDELGSVYGNAIITNKAKTETIEIKPEAKAEVIVNIQTGQVVIKYAIIIGVLVISTIGLFIIKKKLEKK